MKRGTPTAIDLDGRKVDYRLIRSKTARKLRVRVGLDGVEVVQPAGRELRELESFLQANKEWINHQVKRVESIQAVRKPGKSNLSEILYRGVSIPVEIVVLSHHNGNNRVAFDNGCLTISKGEDSQTSPVRSLENWLRKQARQEIIDQLNIISAKLGKHPNKVYVMGQKTKWGNCSSLHNLSFNWRLIMAPAFVLTYLVTHEAVHLEVPDHSKRFWLTVQSLCPDMEKAKQWLCANNHRIMVDLRQVCNLDGESWTPEF